MNDIKVYYDSANNVVLDCEGQELVMSREEAEWLFVDLGHCLKDMDYRDKERIEDESH